ncbi:hypothetical protein B0I35DRAFT_93293 [Stachybotrys elegans]|uniref:Uncharacterized protein n=1 Tax=Stachybotrys elegans TaxID=80388 RepID=A0A8K0WLQ4_9HYPO|nr:hypothetical protein B0I35DRAFT_93293 [Stachybotrys elegans]
MCIGTLVQTPQLTLRMAQMSVPDWMDCICWWSDVGRLTRAKGGRAVGERGEKPGRLRQGRGERGKRGVSQGGVTYKRTSSEEPTRRAKARNWRWNVPEPTTVAAMGRHSPAEGGKGTARGQTGERVMGERRPRGPSGIKGRSLPRAEP